MNLRHILLPLACLPIFALAGCGFHPRAELTIPPGLGPVKVVSSNPYSPLGDSLARALTRAGAQAADEKDEHVATLRIVGETWTEGPLSVDIYSQVREDIVTYTVRFAFVSADNKDISALQVARIQRDFVYDQSHALGSSEEQGTIHEEMQRDMAATIIRRIGIALRNFQP